MKLILPLLLCAVPAFAQNAAADLKPTAADSKLSGRAVLSEEKGGLRVKVTLENAPAGEHGLHIHDFGDCADSGKAAGGHYNPHGAAHGHAPKDGPKKSHPGDMGNITVGADGKATLEVVLPKVSLSGGKVNAAGRAIILHEKADDFGQPTGNAGGRIGCGVIYLTAKP